MAANGQVCWAIVLSARLRAPSPATLNVQPRTLGTAGSLARRPARNLTPDPGSDLARARPLAARAAELVGYLHAGRDLLAVALLVRRLHGRPFLQGVHRDALGHPELGAVVEDEGPLTRVDALDLPGDVFRPGTGDAQAQQQSQRDSKNRAHDRPSFGFAVGAPSRPTVGEIAPRFDELAGKGKARSCPADT